MRSIIVMTAAVLVALLIGLPADAQLHPRSPLVCKSINGLQTVMDRVVNEQQVAPATGRPSQDIMRDQGSCDYVDTRRVTDQQFLGYIRTDRWLVPVESVCLMTDDPSWPSCGWLRPVDILSRSDWALPRYCDQRVRQFDGVRVWQGSDGCRPIWGNDTRQRNQSGGRDHDRDGQRKTAEQCATMRDLGMKLPPECR